MVAASAGPLTATSDQPMRNPTMSPPLAREPAWPEPHSADPVDQGGLRRRLALASLLLLIPLLLLVNCSGSVGSQNRMGPGNAVAASGAAGSGNAGAGSGTSPSYVAGADGGLGTVDIQNPPAKAISRLTNAQFIRSAAALVGDSAVAGGDTLLPEQTIQSAFRNARYAQHLPFDLIKAFDAAAPYIAG